VTVLCGNLHRDQISSDDLGRIEAACQDFEDLRVFLLEGDTMAKTLAGWSNLPGLWWLYYRAYRRWQRTALEKAQILHAEEPFDCTHHLTYIGFREPGELWRLGCPHFWGPISGSPMVPWAFLKTFRLSQIYRWGGRNLGNWWQMRFSRRCLEAARASAKIWAVSESDREMARRHWGICTEALLETGTEKTVDFRIRTYSGPEPLQLVWSGRFDSIKMLPVVLRALDKLHEYAWRLEVLGDGPEANIWRQKARCLRTANRVHWRGMLEREDALRVMADAHVLLHSSVKEGTPHVILEAIGLGLPVVCHAACGMGIAIDDRCGITLPLRSPEESVMGFAEAIRRLLTEPGLVETLSIGAGIRAGELSWDSKVQAFRSEYEKCFKQ
jgi:glycosyltransferase involved in cell wall biosynthesis